MVEIDYEVDDGVDGAWDEPRTQALIDGIVARELPPGAYRVALHLVGDATIQALNREHRAKDAPTDVLSFPLLGPADGAFPLPAGEAVHLGDVVVSYPRVLAQAEEYGHSAGRELAYLTTHGILHLLGYDHEDEDDRLRMRAKEEAALRPLGLTR